MRITPAKFSPERDDTKRTADLLSRELTVRTHEDVVAYLGMSQVGRGFPAPMITSLERHPWGPETVILRATMRVRDRDKGTALDVTATESLMLPISNFELLHRHISLLERLLKHELLENFYVAGRRILDPHK